MNGAAARVPGWSFCCSLLMTTVWQGHQGEGERVPGAPRPQLTLLSDISGAFCPGRLTCLMGVSGAGKTTLMDVLAGRKTGRASGHSVLGSPDDISQ